MPVTHATIAANLAEQLHDNEIHVWHLVYRQSLRRQPLHALLAAYLGIDAQRLSLVDDPYGRPALAPLHDQSLGFNWSHSGAHALIAVGRRITPGIDIEQRRSRPRALEIARRFFSVEEAAALAALPADQRSAAFLDVWTAKEAVLKALGRGLAFGLHRLSIARSDSGLLLRQLEDDDVSAWQLQSLSIDPALVAALAWRGAARTLRHFTLAEVDEA